MKFGLEEKKRMTGAGLYARAFQLTALLPVLYFFAVPNYMPVITKPGILSFLFDLGISALPRSEALILSCVYRLTSNEIIVHFAILLTAFAFGIAANKLLKGSPKTARTARIVFAVLIGADLLIRLLPLRFNIAFGLGTAIAGFAVRLVCLMLILCDLRAARTRENLSK